MPGREGGGLFEVTEKDVKRLEEQYCKKCLPKAIALAKSLANDIEARPKRKKLPKPGQENWIPLRKLFKTAKVPEDVADVIQRAIEKMKKVGDISDNNIFQMLEFLCADYLAEAD